MRKPNWKSWISFLLMASFLCALLPLGLASYFSAAARADQADDKWQYTIGADGYASVLGYADASSVKLQVPRVLGGAFVVRIEEGAFSENNDLREITIPASVREISDTAFSDHAALAVFAPKGSAAMKFAQKRGFEFISTSDFDLMDGISDLSEMTDEQFSINGKIAVIGAPYADMIAKGDKLFLPACGGHPYGVPVEVTDTGTRENGKTVSVRILDFTEAVKTYEVQNVPAKPDASRMVILADGFTYVEAPKGKDISGSIGKEISFAVNYDSGKGKAITGKLSYEPSYEISLSYKHFSLEEFSYTNKSKTAINLTYKDSTDLKDAKADPDIIKFAKLPLTTPSLVSVWLELSLVVSVEGEVTIETSMTTTETMTWTKNNGASSIKTKSVDYVSASAAIGVSVELKLAIVVNLGFSATDFNVDVAELSVSLGVKANVKFLDSGVDCKELDIDGIFRVGIKLGILSSDWPKVSLDITLFSLKWDAITLHMEFDPFKIVRECTKDVVTVTFSANGGTKAPNPVTIKRDSLIKAVDEPVRNGYIFTGWYTDSKCDVLWQMDNDPVTESMTLYAGWEEIKPEATPSPAPTNSLKTVPNIPVQSASASLQYLKYVVNTNNVVITGYTGQPETLTIPSTIEGKPVTEIDSGAFKSCNSLKRVTIPSSVEIIDSWAFLNCKSLVVVDIPSTLKTMGSTCFSGCSSLMEAYIPGNLEVIGIGMFNNCSSLQKATVGAGITFLPGTTFENCDALVEVHLPSTIESIEGSAFYDCDALQEIRLPAGLKKIGTSAFYGCGALHTADIPLSVESIASSAFKGTALTKVYLQGALKSMGDGVYANCVDLKKVYFSCPLEVLPANCFRECSALEDVTLPGGLTHIDGYAFEYCRAIDEIRFPSTLIEIGSGAFNGCTALEKAEMQFGLTTIGSNAFNACKSLESPDFPYSLKSIGSYAFRNCDSMEKVELIGDEMNVWNSAFKECDGIKTVSLSGIKTLDAYAFADCRAMETLTISSIETIGSNAFAECDSVTEVILPEGLTSIGNSAFIGCDKLEKVTFPMSLKTLESSAFKNCVSLEKVKISGSLQNMGSNTFWKCTSLEEAVLNTPKLSLLPDSAFRSCTSLVKVTLPDDMTQIHYNAFYDCCSLTDIVWPTKLKVIENDAFHNCSSLEKLHLPESVVTIGSYTFAGCTSLVDIRLPKGLQNLGSRAFTACSSLEEVRITGDFKNLGSHIFQNCNSLASVTFAPGVTITANAMFMGCSSLTEVIFPDSMTGLSTNTFDYCTKLPYIMLGPNVKDFGSCVFDGCWSLGCVYVYTMDCPAVSYFESKYPRVAIALVGDRVTVQFDSMGGSYVPSVYSAPGAFAPMPEEPEKEDYTLTGWYVDAELSDMWLFDTDKVKGDMTLYAGWNYTPKDMKYQKKGSGVTLTDYSGDKTVLKIPEELNGLPVTGIGPEALNEELTVVHIPACVTDISSTAFRWSKNLTTITVDEGNTAYYAKDGVLYSADGTLVCYPCGKTAISFTPGEGTTAIGDHAFYDVDGINKLVIPSSVKSMGAYAVYDCDALREVVFEGDLKPGDGCFMFCHREMDITGPEEAPGLAAYADRIYVKFNEYNVIFKENGVLLGAYRVRAGKLLGEPPRPDDGEMTFVGWSETGKEKDLWNFAAQPMPAKDVTLHAVWKLDFTTRKTQDGGIELVNYTGDKTVIQIPDVIDGKKVVSIADDCFPDETVTLTGNSGSAADEWAKKKGMEFVPLKYTVTFIPGGGTQPPALTLSVGQKVPAPETFREGYILNGWYTDQYFGGRFDFENDLMPQHDLALYALWTKEADADEIPFTYEEGETGLIITGYIGAPGAAVIPESINGMPVAAIAPYAFYEEENLYGLTVPGSVKTIGECALSGSAVTFVEVKNGVEVIESLAFADCAQLTSLKLPDSVHTLGNHALQGLSALTSIAIPEGVTVLYEGLLNGCTFLSSVSLPSKLESIGAKAFAECPLLKTIEIPSSVTFVDNSAFKGCKALEKIVSEGTHFRSADGVLLSSDGKTLVCYPQGKTDEEWAVPDGVEFISENALNGAAFTILSLPDSVTVVGSGAVRNCARLEELNCGKGLETLGANALSGCMSLMKVNINTFASVESQAIPAVSGLTVYAPAASPAQVYAVENGIRFVPALSWETVLPEELTQIRAKAFAGTAVVTVYCPDGLNSIGDGAFAGSTLKCIRIPKSVNVISETAFMDLEGLIIVAPAGSAAQNFADRMGIAFSAE